ncbi:MAG: thiamine-phosphate kinase [Gammaproteobacteria bacterium]|nr:thiamine-phosphate kinase [Gammaproteobacteria bacterium]MCH9744928.1 thiamine-phosphate kinase [Gammaproteobacteria bacterium]
MSGEFNLIKNHFTRDKLQQTSNQLGTGDDAAVIEAPDGKQLVTSIDTLVSGIHFPEDTDAFDIGFKAVAVSLSDMAAMGATPTAMLISLTIPDNDENWLELFAKGIFELLNQHQVDLIGGDMSRGPLSISTVAMGLVDKDCAITRSGAQIGDAVYVSGTLGDAAYALLNDQTLAALNRPQPRVLLGQALAGIASAAIDISDGLAADLSKLIEASRVGATVFCQRLPLSSLLLKQCDHEQALQFALSGGDDYELCFTVPQDKIAALEAIQNNIDCDIHCIGAVVDGTALDIIDSDGKSVIIKNAGFDHFKERQ